MFWWYNLCRLLSISSVLFIVYSSLCTNNTRLHYRVRRSFIIFLRKYFTICHTCGICGVWLTPVTCHLVSCNLVLCLRYHFPGNFLFWVWLQQLGHKIVSLRTSQAKKIQSSKVLCINAKNPPERYNFLSDGCHITQVCPAWTHERFPSMQAWAVLARPDTAELPHTLEAVLHLPGTWQRPQLPLFPAHMVSAYWVPWL